MKLLYGIETEVKFVNADFGQIRRNLKKLRTEKKFLKKGFEYTQLWDTRDLRLKRGKKLLRIRSHGKKFILGFKEKIKGHDTEFKNEKELEIEISGREKEKLEKVFARMGFHKWWRYEIKYEQWKLGKCVLDLDTLPFVQCLEIEGKPWEIKKCAQLLELNWDHKSTKNYRKLYGEWLERHNKKWQNCVFKHG